MRGFEPTPLTAPLPRGETRHIIKFPILRPALLSPSREAIDASDRGNSRSYVDVNTVDNRADPMALFEWIYRYFWLIAIVVGCINSAIIWSRLQPQLQAHPERRAGYVTLVKGYWFIGTFPWLVMGMGILVGGVPHLLYYLYPQVGNAYVLAWWATLWLMQAWLTVWLLWQGGAEMLVSQPGFMRGKPTSARRLKFYWLLMLAGAVTATVLIFSQTPTDLPSLNRYV